MVKQPEQFTNMLKLLQINMLNNCHLLNKRSFGQAPTFTYIWTAHIPVTPGLHREFHKLSNNLLIQYI